MNFGLRTGLSVVGLLLCATGALAAPGSPESRAAVIQDGVTDLEKQIGRLESNYGQRRGLMGAEEARERYREAVYQYLVGHYERAADTFFALVESRSLADPSLAHDSEWYLAECLFELKNYTLAIEAYQRMVDAGEGHPFFPDSVRRLLETYGILKDNVHFSDVYSRYIASGRVAATDLIKYTVAKSFWRQGENARAKALLTELQSGAMFTRARYLYGAILTEEDDYVNAIQEFNRVLEGTAAVTADNEIFELAHMALGRLYYETGEYVKASDEYQAIQAASPYYADSLYEQVWTFIKREKWSNARDQVQVFLTGFPDNRYAPQLKLIDGHLFMKEAESATGMDVTALDQAQQAYEAVVAEYTPVREHIAEIEAQREDIGHYFTRIANAESLEEEGGLLPAYALEMLTSHEGVTRALDLRRELDRQGSDIELSQSIIEELELIVMGGADSIGTFRRGREQIRSMREEALRLRDSLVEVQLQALRQSGGDGVASAEDRLADLRESSARALSQQGTSSDRLAIHDAQIREVQGQGFRLRQEMEALQDEVTATRRVLKENEPRLSRTDARVVRDELDALEAELGRVGRDLERVESPATRRRVMSAVTGQGDNGAAAFAQLARDYQGLYDQVTGLRSRSGGVSSDDARRYDDLWGRVGAADTRAAAALQTLGAEERIELEQLKRRLARETTEVARSTSELGEARKEADLIALEATRNGFSALEAEFADTVLQADNGVVDVYWLKETRVNDEMERIRKERANRQAELEARFEIIRQKLQE